MASGARLQGSGTAGAVSVLSGGKVAPGNSIGVLSVSSISFATGSIFEVEANAAGQSDRITASGTATINGGMVQVLAQNGSYALNTQYTILSAAGGVVGPGFGSVTSNLAFLTPSLAQTANSVVLTLRRNNIDFATIGGTFNQRSAGRGVQLLGAGGVYNAVLSLDEPTARVAFDAVSGEIHPSMRTALFDDSRLPREAVLRHLDNGAKGHLGMWGEGFGDWGHSDPDGNAAGLDRDSAGVVMGIDAAAGKEWRLGIAGGYTHLALDLPARASTGRANMVYGSLYGGADYGPIRIMLGAAYSHIVVDTDRPAVFTGFADQLKASYNGSILQSFGELDYRLPLGRGAAGPFGRLAVVHLNTDGFAERGGSAALTGASDHDTRAITTLGLFAATPVLRGLWADGRVGWRRAFGQPTLLSAVRFAGGNSFMIAGVPYSRNAGVAEGGLNLQATSGLAVSVRYSGVIGEGGDNNALKGGLRLAF